MTDENELEVEVFRSGDYGEKGVYSNGDLEAVARDYDPGTHEAPVTLDHAQSGPAHGWVGGLKVMGDRLVARLRQVSPALAEALRAGSFRKRSVELFRKFRGTGRPYLKAVSFLGAATPHVNGLADPAFDDGGAEVLLFSGPADDPAVTMSTEDFRRRLVDAGAWNPVWEERGLFDLYAALPDDAAAERLLSVLAAAPAPVPLGEMPKEDARETERFTARLHGVDRPASADEHIRALALMGEAPDIDYRTALLRAAGGDGRAIV